MAFRAPTSSLQTRFSAPQSIPFSQRPKFPSGQTLRLPNRTYIDLTLKTSFTHSIHFKLANYEGALYVLCENPLSPDSFDIQQLNADGTYVYNNGNPSHHFTMNFGSFIKGRNNSINVVPSFRSETACETDNRGDLSKHTFTESSAVGVIINNFLQEPSEETEESSESRLGSAILGSGFQLAYAPVQIPAIDHPAPTSTKQVKTRGLVFPPSQRFKIAEGEALTIKIANRFYFISKSINGYTVAEGGLEIRPRENAQYILEPAGVTLRINAGDLIVENMSEEEAVIERIASRQSTFEI